MPSILSTNMASLYAQRSLATAQADVATSVQRLSSGKRINSAKDDAAGLGISEGIAGVRNISDQSIRNLQNAGSLVQTAEGALEVVNQILQRALTLTTQKNDATLNSDQQGAIDSEINSLLDEIGRIRERTKFNSNETIFGASYGFGSGVGIMTSFTIPELTIPALGLNGQTSSASVDSVSLARQIQAAVELLSPISATSSGQQIQATASQLAISIAATSSAGQIQASTSVASSIPGEVQIGMVQADLGTADPVLITPASVAGTVNASDTFNLVNNFSGGEQLVYHQGSGNVIDGLVDGHTYFVISSVDGNSFKLARTSIEAGAGTAIDLTGLGSSTDAYFVDVNSSDTFNVNSVGIAGESTNVLIVNQPQWGLYDKIFFHQGSASNIGGFSDFGVYTISGNDGVGITLQDSSGNPVLFNASTNLNGAVIEYAPDSKFISFSNINLTTNQFQSNNHGLQTGQEVFYTPQPTLPGGTPIQIGGVSANTAYFVISTGTNTFKLATTYQNAQNSNAIDLTSLNGTGKAQFYYANQLNNTTSFTSNPVLQPNTILLDIGGLTTGDAVVYHVDPSGSVIGGLADGSTYYAISTSDPNTFQLSASPGGSAINLSGQGSGPQNFVRESKLTFNSGDSNFVNTDTNMISTVEAHGFELNAPIYYHTDISGNEIGGLDNNTIYYAIPAGTNKFQLSAGIDGPAINLTSLGIDTQSFTRLSASNTLTATGHGFASGEALLYVANDGSGNEIGGLTSGQTYYAITSADPNTFQLAANPGGQAVALTSPGRGVQSFTPTADFLIDSSGNHGFTTGQAIRYRLGNPGNAIGGLTNNQTYYAIETNDPTKFELSATSGGPAINLTSAGTGTQSFSYVISNDITATAHGFASGEAIYYVVNDPSGNEIGGLTSGHTYYAITSADPDTFQLSESPGGSAITLTGPGSGLQYFSPISNTLTDSSGNHGFTNGQAITYHVDNSGNAIGGLTNNQTYYAITTNDPTKFELSATSGGPAINLTTAGIGPQNFSYMSSNDLTKAGHGFVSGEAILYSADDGPVHQIGGLISGHTYYAITSADPDTFQLSESPGGSAIILTSPGSGDQYFSHSGGILTDTSGNHGFTSGQAITYHVDNPSNAIGGLTNNQTYYAITTNDPTQFELADSSGNAQAGTAVNLTSAGIGPQNFSYMSSNDLTKAGHGFVSGEALLYIANDGSGNEIGGLTSGHTYYAITSADPDTFQLSESPGGSAITLTGPGSGLQYFSPISNTLTDSSGNHGFTNGQAITYHVDNSGNAIGGLTNNQTYYAITTNDPTKFELSATSGGPAINFTSSGIGTQSFTVNGNLINSTAHGLSTGDEVIYSADGGTVIGGLAEGGHYFVIKNDDNSFELSATNGGSAINLTSIGGGVFTHQSAAISVSSISNAITINSSNRAELGVLSNSISYAIDNLQTLSSNLSDAYSRIVDTDYASETSNLTRSKILQQASAAMLAQANQMPNVILSLLK
ncbi:flagellin [Polynucleobacter sp. MWH-Berg-3C6]|uniref:flagellin N-terminal helical domain-containing protein n=1 Tax=Polynucleobacter sp. MWH-Berg-3C6 TaxID=1855882 RepID=UPI001C0E1EDD|nr:flagellin [Polynucleobacter sp. MWH-Berg-3C6]MBU3550697.1 hypothetical protein [Polynucleobacter sp. MWH-Berg-3C6]